MAHSTNFPAKGRLSSAIARIATSQNGAVTHAQLVQAGLEHPAE